MLRSLALALLPAAVHAAGFPDVPPKHWARAAIDQVAALGLMGPAKADRFEGAEPVTRYSLAESLLAMAKLPELAGLADGSEAGPPVEEVLKDVAPGTPRYPAVANALGAGLMETKDDRFEGDATLDRYDLARFLARVVDFVDSDASGTLVSKVPVASLVLSDVPPDHSARAEVEKVLVAGLLTETKGKFEGVKPVTRFQLAMILSRVVELTREARARDAAARASAQTTAPAPVAEAPAPAPVVPAPLPPAAPASAAPPPAGADPLAEARELRQRARELSSLAQDLEARAARLEAALSARR